MHVDEVQVIEVGATHVDEVQVITSSAQHTEEVWTIRTSTTGTTAFSGTGSSLKGGSSLCTCWCKDCPAHGFKLFA